MNLRNFYESSGIDYDALLRRLMNKESLVEKYMKLFLNDPTFFELEEAIKVKDYKSVDMKAHTLKGMTLNLNLEKMSQVCMEILNSVRANHVENIETLLEELRAERERIVSFLAE